MKGGLKSHTQIYLCFPVSRKSVKSVLKHPKMDGVVVKSYELAGGVLSEGVCNNIRKEEADERQNL